MLNERNCSVWGFMSAGGSTLGLRRVVLKAACVDHSLWSPGESRLGKGPRSHSWAMSVLAVRRPHLDLECIHGPLLPAHPLQVSNTDKQCMGLLGLVWRSGEYWGCILRCSWGVCASVFDELKTASNLKLQPSQVSRGPGRHRMSRVSDRGWGWGRGGGQALPLCTDAPHPHQVSQPACLAPYAVPWQQVQGSAPGLLSRERLQRMGRRAARVRKPFSVCPRPGRPEAIAFIMLGVLLFCFPVYTHTHTHASGECAVLSSWKVLRKQPSQTGFLAAPYQKV